MRKSLVIGGALVLVLAGAYVFLTVAKPFAEKKAAAAASVPVLFDLGGKEVAKVSIEGKGAEKAVIVKTDSGYAVEGKPSIALDKDKVDPVFSVFDGTHPNSVIEEKPKNPADYGLDSPRTITATLKDGRALTLQIGSKTPSGDYYVRKGGGDTVYSLGSWEAEKLAGSLSDLRVTSLPAVDPQKITYFKLGGGGRTIEIVQAKDPANTFSQFDMVKPYRRSYEINSQTFGDLIQKMPQFAKKSFIDNPGALPSYGLDPAVMEIDVKDDANELHLLVGKAAGADEAYAKLAGQREIFTLAKSDLDFLKDVAPFGIVSHLGMLVNIDSVDSLTFKTPAASYLLEIKRKPAAAPAAGAAASADAEKPVPDYYVNGTKIEESVFKTCYQTIIGILFEGENPKPGAVSPAAGEASVVFALTGGKGTERFDFVPYDADYYAFVSASYSEFLVTRSQVATAAATVGKLIAAKPSK
jgi:hypothetical protein